MGLDQLSVAGLISDPDGTRTHDPSIKSALRYQLRYGIIFRIAKLQNNFNTAKYFEGKIGPRREGILVLKIFEKFFLENFVRNSFYSHFCRISFFHNFSPPKYLLLFLQNFFFQNSFYFIQYSQLLFKIIKVHYII